MKNLNIIMIVKANNTDHAELIAKNELMELAKAVARNHGLYMAECEGSAMEVANGNYKVDAVCKLDGNENIDATVRTIQALWMTKPNIIKSAIFVTTEEKRNEPEAYAVCRNCGQAGTEDNMSIVHNGSAGEYYVCDECLDKMYGDRNIINCNCCDELIDANAMIENPVTHQNTICPCCGENT